MIRDRLDSLHEFWAHRHWLVKLLIVSVILAVVVALAGRPVYRQVVEWRCDHNLDRAGEALRSGRLDEARSLSFAVMQLRPGDLDALRLAEQAMEKLGDPRSGDAARFVFGHTGANDDDRRRCWSVITARLPLGQVGQAWNQLDAERQQEPDFLFPFVDRLIAERHWKDAVTALAPQDFANTSTEIERRVLAILIGSGNPEGFLDAQTRLLDRIECGAEDIGELLPVLDPLPQEHLHQPLAQALAQWLERRPDAGPANCLAVARFQIATASGEDAVARVNAEIARWREQAPAELVGWLLRIDRPEQALDVAPAGRPDEVEMYRLQSQAFADLERWEELSDHLAERPLGMPKLEWFCDQAIAASMCGDTARFGEAWTNATGEGEIGAANGSYLKLARLAKGGGLEMEAEHAMLQAIRAGQGPLPLYRELAPLLKSLYGQGKARELFDIVSAYLSFEPWNPAVLVQYCYLGSLNGHVDAGFARDLLEQCRQKLDNALPVRCTIALAELLAGDHARALEASDVVGADWSAASPEYRIIHGIALATNGWEIEADMALNGVSWAGLMPLEHKVLSELLAKVEREPGLAGE